MINENIYYAKNVIDNAFENIEEEFDYSDKSLLCSLGAHYLSGGEIALIDCFEKPLYYNYIDGKIYLPKFLEKTPLINIKHCNNIVSIDNLLENKYNNYYFLILKCEIIKEMLSLLQKNNMVSNYLKLYSFIPFLENMKERSIFLLDGNDNKIIKVQIIIEELIEHMKKTNSNIEKYVFLNEELIKNQNSLLNYKNKILEKRK